MNVTHERIVPVYALQRDDLVVGLERRLFPKYYVHGRRVRGRERVLTGDYKITFADGTEETWSREQRVMVQ